MWLNSGFISIGKAAACPWMPISLIVEQFVWLKSSMASIGEGEMGLVANIVDSESTIGVGTVTW